MKFLNSIELYNVCNIVFSKHQRNLKIQRFKRALAIIPLIPSPSPHAVERSVQDRSISKANDMQI